MVQKVNEVLGPCPCYVVNKHLMAEQLAVSFCSASKGQLQSKHFRQVDIEEFPQYWAHLEENVLKDVQKCQTHHCPYFLLLRKVQVESDSSAILQWFCEDIQNPCSLRGNKGTTFFLAST